jgi:hypothetical protein
LNFKVCLRFIFLKAQTAPGYLQNGFRGASDEEALIHSRQGQNVIAFKKLKRRQTLKCSIENR